MFAGVDLLLDQLDKLLEVAAEEARLNVLRRAMAAARAEAEITDTGAVCCVNCLSFPIDAVRLHDLGSAAVADVGQVAVRAAEISESEAAGCVNRLPSLSEDGFEAARRTAIGAASEMFGARLAAAVDEDEEQLRRAMATDKAEKEEARHLHKLKMSEPEVSLAASRRAADLASASIGAACAPLLSSLSEAGWEAARSSFMPPAPAEPVAVIDAVARFEDEDDMLQLALMLSLQDINAISPPVPLANSGGERSLPSHCSCFEASWCKYSTFPSAGASDLSVLPGVGAVPRSVRS